MRQVLLNRRGEVRVLDIPAPRATPGRILVRTAYSVISPGTERSALHHHDGGVVRRAISRPDLLRSLARQAVTDGLAATAGAVASRLSDLSPLGYSLAGTVLTAGEGVSGFATGDSVACGGAEHAHHAEIVAVPSLLTATVPGNVSLKAAAFASIGAIALQAVRRSRAAIGETIVVTGLGVVGQLVCQLLIAAGCGVLGIEPTARRADLARSLGASDVFRPDLPDLSEQIRQRTAGLGADAVVICAATASSDPVNQAVSLARERGRVVIVGDVGLEVRRDEFYRKELDLVISRSMGPGRYDPIYEQQGIDYPPAYVRWTEHRNMVAFLQLLDTGRVQVEPLISAEVAIEDAADAYERLDTAETMTVVLRYTEAETVPDGSSHVASLATKPRLPMERTRLPLTAQVPVSGQIGVGLIGAGAIARAAHLPQLKRSRVFVLQAVVSQSGVSAHNAGRQAGAAYVATTPEDIFADPSVNVVWITTPHDSHADLAIGALQAGKHVFVEKPLALTLADCHRVRDAVVRSGRLLTVGFNRRFAPASVIVRDHVADAPGPRQVIYRVRSESLPEGHWLDDPERGGGRLLGEGCHFFDWMAWLLGEEPETVWAARVPDKTENVTVTVVFSRGSVGTLIYACAGAQETPKERVEILAGDRTAVIDNFEAVDLLRSGRGRQRVRARGKGYAEQLDAFVQALQSESALAVTVDDGIRATAVALAAQAALRDGTPQPVRIDI